MALSALSFALAAVVSVYCADDLGVWHLVLIRSAVLVVLLLPWWARHRVEARGVNRTGLLARGLSGTFMTLLFFYALAHIPLGVGMTLIRSFPLWVVLLLWLFAARRPTGAELAALAAALVGIGVIYRPQDFVESRHVHIIGIAAALGSAFCQAISYIEIRRLHTTEQGTVINWWLGWTGLAVCFPFAFFGAWPRVGTTWLLAVIIGICVFAGQTFQVQGLKWVNATVGGIFNLGASVGFAVLLGWACFGQKLNGQEAAGMLLVLSAGVLVTLFAGDRIPKSLGKKGTDPFPAKTGKTFEAS